MISELLVMGGHGIYVWSAYLLCALVLAVNFIQPSRELVRLKKTLSAKQKKRDA